jgi:hypothetical protein
MQPIRTKTVSRFDAVREQINSAIRLFFLWDELVSAVTLAGAAERVLSDLQPQDGIFGVDAHSIRSIVNLYIKEGHHKDAAKAFRKDYDFFRHADRNITQNSYELKESSVAWLIFTSIISFESLKQKKTMEMRGFYYWLMAHNPHWLKPNAPDLPTIIKMQGEISGRPKREYFLAFVAASEGRIPKDLDFILGGDTVPDADMTVRSPSIRKV